MDTKEYSLLSSFLLSTASLPVIISLADFTELFPASQRDNPTIRILYRDLQHQRGLVTDTVKKNLIQEAIKGETQKREILRIRRRGEREQFAARTGAEAREVGAEAETLGPLSNLPSNKSHSLRSIQPELEAACADVEAEAEAVEYEIAEVLKDMQATVGNLSDLRYGRMGRTSGGVDGVGKDVLEGLRGLRETCDNISNG